MKLTRNVLFIMLVLMVSLPLSRAFGQDTFLDQFNSVSYANNDGTQNWNADWVEFDNGGTDPSAGRIRINSNQLRFRNMDSRQVRRTLDLSGYSTAVLTFDYNRTSGNESVGAYFFNTVTGSYDFAVATPTGGGASGSLSFNIPAAYINASSEILFNTASGDWGGSETVFIDNVLITATPNTPFIAIDDVTVNENAGTLDFTVSHTGGTTSGSFTVQYNTANGTAVTTDDYNGTGATNPTITFTGTSLSNQTISIPIVDDNFAEATESFFIDLSNPSDGSVNITDSQGEGTINDDDDASIAINDISVDEGAGTVTLTVTLSGANVENGFTVEYETVEGTATDPEDYTATGSPNPTLTFAGTINETETITIPIIDDSDLEGNHNFFIDLSNISNTVVTISDAQGEVTITDNDGRLVINDVSVDETTSTAVFTVTLLDANVPGGFTVDFATLNGSATAGLDYTASAGTLTFAGTINETETITITITDDTDVEGDETFFVNLSNSSSAMATIDDNQGQGTIIDDETPFIITDGVTDVTCSGVFVDSGSLSSNYSNGENITYTLCPTNAATPILLDFRYFAVETFWDGLQIYNGTNTIPANLIGTFDNGNLPGVIQSTDPNGCLTFIFSSDFIVNFRGWLADIYCASSVLTVNDVTVSENAGTATFNVTFTGTAIPGGFTVDYATEDDSALADSDYTNTTGSLNFSGTPGQMLTITVPIINNTFAENNETFFVGLNNPSVAGIGLVTGTGTITDDGDSAIGNDVPLTLFDEFNGYYDYSVTAGTLRTQDEGVDPCAITTSSSNTLTTPIPAGSTIEKAYLVWGHSHISADDVVTFEGQTVTADLVNTVFGFYYGMVSDVTSIVQGVTDPSTNVYDFSGLTIDNGLNGDVFEYCGGTVVFGGWSLFVFYTNPTFPAVSINMYNGFDGGTDSNTNYTLDGFFAIGSSGSKTSILSWEGDAGRTGNEVISVTTGAGTTNLTGDGNNNPPTLNNVFNATIFDDTAVPVIDDSSLFGFDLDTYDISALIAQGETTATTNVQTGGDLVVLNSVLLKVPSNLITGFVFEDMNYPGGVGRDRASSSGAGIEGVTLELYDNTGTFVENVTTDINGEYSFGGMANGTYSVRVVSNTVRSNRGGASCTTCLPVQTFRASYASSTLSSVTTEVGGADPSAQDVAAGILTGAQSVASVEILNEGAVGLDFGFNFNTIVNTNTSGQGSLGQFIINANNLNETGLDIEANSIFNPAAGEDTSIFMIPPTGDALGRTADTNFASGFFDINQSTALDPITDDSTHIDGRTQTAYSGDTNTGTVGSGGTAVGISATTLPNYDLPEIQLRSDFGDVVQLQASNLVIRNLSVYGGNRRAIRQDSGTGNLITSNLMGVNALGVVGTVGVGSYVDDGFEINGGGANLDGNYIASNTDFGISVNGGTSTIIQNNHITNNGFRNCEYNIRIANGSGVVIRNNLINGSAAAGVFDNQGNVSITENTITTAGSDNGCPETSGIILNNNDTSVSTNIINNNGGSGISLTGGNTSGNLISQNSIFANGTITPSLGIDINDDGVTINDNGDGDNGPNGSLNFPIFESATIFGTTLRIRGWARPGATIEVFLTDINQGTATVGDNQLGLTQDYGEGQTFLATVVEGSGADSDATTSTYNVADGNTDNTNRFDFSITLSSMIPIGSMITGTATISNSTSEFGGSFMITGSTVITNRRITYRVKPN